MVARRLLPLVLALFLGPLGRAEDDGPVGPLPEGFEVVGARRVPDGALGPFAARLGARLDAVWHVALSLNGLPAQVNLVVGADEEAARAVEARLLAARGEPFVGRRGLRVYEVVGTNPTLGRRLRSALGAGGDGVARWNVSFRAALVDEGVAARQNALFNLFVALERDPGSEEVAGEIRRALEGYRFGRTLSLAASRPGLAVAWSFEPAPLRATPEGETVRYEFADAPRRLGVPFVEVRGTLEVRARTEPHPAPRPEGLCDATAVWPVDAVAEEARAAVAGETSDAARALALLRHLRARVRYGGEVGSRDPVVQVLARGYARCFDGSDAFVAFARAVGLPARIVAGWAPTLGDGHVWTEVHLEGRGWIPVDATTPWLGITEDYLPFFLSEDGNMPFLYLGMPTVEPNEG